MKTADKALAVVITIDERPDAAWVLVSHKLHFFAVSLEEVADIAVISPTGVRIEVVWHKRVTVLKFVFSDLDECGHGWIPFQGGAGCLPRG